MSLANAIDFGSENVGINERADTLTLDKGFRLIPGAAAGDVLTSDALGNGTWASASQEIAQTVVLKGSGSGVAYTSTDNSGTFTDVDPTNLKTTIMIPTGWKLLINCRFYGFRPQIAAPGGSGLSIVDTTTSAFVDSSEVGAGASPAFYGGSLIGVINGDGLSHTVSLQWACNAGGAGARILGNNPLDGSLPNISPAASNTPVIILQLLHSG
jgi:hypothetical protein